METHIARLNGNGIHNVPTPPDCGSIWKGYRVMAINNFSNFGLDRKVIYYRPEAERVATSLNKQLVPGAELGPAPRLADTIDVEVVLDHDLGSNRRPKLRRRMGRTSKGLSPSGRAP